MTDCTADRFEFQGPGRRQIVASFDGGRLSSDGGAVLLRRLGLAGSTMANCYCGTIRTRLLKIGARVRVSVRRVWISLASSHPAEPVFAHAYDQLLRAGP